MRALVQRVSEATVSVENQVVGQIAAGLVIFLGVTHADGPQEAKYLAQKVSRLRIFADEEGKMNRSLLDVSGEALIVSQFTLYGDTSRGNRPSYTNAAKADSARVLYDYFVDVCREVGLKVSTGVFQAYMKVSLVNDGPITLMCDSMA